MPFGKDTKKVVVEVSGNADKDLKKIANQMGNLNRNTKKIAKSAGQLSLAFRGFIGVHTIRSFTRAADQIQLIKDRITVFSSSAQDAEERFNGLTKAAEFTKTSVGALGDVYARLALSTAEMNLSQTQLLDLTTALQQSFRLSGSSLEEARAASIQFAQGLSSGALRGDELRSVTENNAVATRILAKELGVTAGRLKDAGREGKITAEVAFRAMSKALPQLNKDAAKLGTTFEQTLIVSLDKLKIKAEELSREFDINGKFAKGMEFIIENMENFRDVVIVLAGAKGLGLLITSLSKLNKLLATGAGIKLLAKIASFGPGGLVTAATAALGLGALAVDKYSNSYSKLNAKLTDAGKRLQDLKKELVVAQVEDRTQGGFVNDMLVALGFGKASISDLKESIKITKKEISDISRNLGGDLGPFDLVGPSPLKPKKKKKIDTTPLDPKELQRLRKLEVAQLKLNQRQEAGIITQRELNIAQSADTVKQLEEAYIKTGHGLYELTEAQRTHLQLLQETPTVAEAAIKALKDYSKEATNLSKNIAGAINSTLGTMEDTMVKFVRTGKLQFKDLINSILDDLARIAVRQAIGGIINTAVSAASARGGAGGSGGNIGSTRGPGETVFAGANGGVVSGGNLQAFANGGMIVSRPTVFPMQNGAGLMGEAGPEAILPLTRRNGKLGVEGGGSNTVVNIINNSGAEVETEESTGADGERQLTVMIGNVVNSNIQAGAFDRTLGESFGLRRRGR